MKLTTTGEVNVPAVALENVTVIVAVAPAATLIELLVGVPNPAGFVTLIVEIFNADVPLFLRDAVHVDVADVYTPGHVNALSVALAVARPTVTEPVVLSATPLAVAFKVVE